ncbi:hypothetical protein LGQ02_19795 [Bacillus shivajii]|uniref:hypothetical protein n=1 Tax=Bacillus shivajii TaxID=1983719 RepID=UPI001CFAE330|nr:hypothetical protein [Bacillus shivajii]UCZ52996.1 hypothetical protein LGQ02_19795 [Bacillus shivajii]
MKKKVLLTLLSGALTVGFLAACGDVADDPMQEEGDPMMEDGEDPVGGGDS